MLWAIMSFIGGAALFAALFTEQLPILPVWVVVGIVIVTVLPVLYGVFLLYRPRVSREARRLAKLRAEERGQLGEQGKPAAP
jgi:membrane protein implicated in regulation of membrane protease activity